MSGGAGRAGAVVAGWFVRPAGAPRRRHRAVAVEVMAEPVVVAPGGSGALGTAAALALAAADGGVGVLACWRVAGAVRARGGVAVAGARRLAGSLRARDVAVWASGRLVVVALPEDEEDAVVVLGRVESACGDVVCLPLLGGARGPAWDGVMAARGAAVVHGEDEELVALAAARLAQQGVDARALGVAPGPVTRALAASGWALPGAQAGLRRALGAGR